MLTSVERERVGARLFPEPTGWRPYLRRFAVLTALSTLIATFGLASDSGAVVIGAMLVAPLMTPLLGVAYGLTMGLRARQVKAAAIVIVDRWFLPPRTVSPHSSASDWTMRCA
jgi:hypothetical protein